MTNSVDAAATAPARSALAASLPGLVAALGFGISNVLGKLAFTAGADVLTLVTFRSVIGIGFMLGALRLWPARTQHSARGRLVALGLGVLFAGNVFAVFKAIELLPVPIAVLAYFVYPLLTGIGARLFGLERLDFRSIAAGLVAFGGLALMLGAQRGELAPLGLGFAFGAATCRTAMLLITRAALVGAEPRLTTFYSLISSTVVLVAASLLTETWALPRSVLGWTGFLGTSLTTTLAILALFASTVRIGPFRTALLMNLEPVVSTLLSLALLGEVMAPLQAVGAAVMIGALVAFQKRA